MKLAAGVAHTVDWRAMLDQLDEEGFQEWMAFDRICPIGPGRMDSAIANYMAGSTYYLGSLAGVKHAELEDITPRSFCGWLPQPGDEASGEEMEAEAMRVNMESALAQAAASLRLQIENES